MRYFMRLSVLVSLSCISIFIILSLYTSSDFYTFDNNELNLLGISSNELLEEDGKNDIEAPMTPIDVKHRMVVFGDAWSAISSQMAGQGRAWPEWFCTMWPCHLEMYPQTEHSVCKNPFCGSVIDSTELHTIVSDTTRSLERLPDLRSQIDQWLVAEFNATRNNPEDGDLKTRSNNTIFAFSFPIWDIWKFRGVPVEDAKASIEHSLDTLFNQLDRLAKYTGLGDLRILLMMSIDPTFLPAFDPSQGQKEVISIVADWNNELKERATSWKGGSIYVFNTDEFLKNQIRSRQFFLAGMSDSQGLGNQNPWDDVENPCVETQVNWWPFAGNKDQRCENPEKFLFWDDLHLGPTANQMMAQEIFQDVEKFWVRSTSLINLHHLT